MWAAWCVWEAESKGPAKALSSHGWEDSGVQADSLFMAVAGVMRSDFFQGSLELNSPCKVPQLMEVVIGVWLSNCLCDANLIA